MTNYRDGNVHEVGPLRLRYRQGRALQEEAECWIKTEGGTPFTLDFVYAEAIATGIEAFSDLFSASESDKSKRGAKRGFLRLRVSENKRQFGELASSDKNEVYQIGRLIMNAGPGEQVTPLNPNDQGRRDYRRTGLRLDPGAGREWTRSRFIEDGICKRIALREGLDAARKLHAKLFGLFGAADGETGDPRVLTFETPT